MRAKGNGSLAHDLRSVFEDKDAKAIIRATDRMTLPTLLERSEALMKRLTESKDGHPRKEATLTLLREYHSALLKERGEPHRRVVAYSSEAHPAGRCDIGRHGSSAGPAFRAQS